MILNGKSENSQVCGERHQEQSQNPSKVGGTHMGFWAEKIVIVTGAGSGLGRTFSESLAARGAKVWMSDIDGDAAIAAAERIGKGCIARKLDVVDADAFKAHIEEVIDREGCVDVIFNNAGINVYAAAEDLHVSHFDKAIDVNFRGVTNGFVAVYSHMVARGSGIIVNTASGSGLVTGPYLSPYSASKFAIVGMTLSLSIEANESGVQVCALCPAAIETPLLDAENPSDTASAWRPNIREYLTEIGGPIKSAESFVNYSLRKIERNSAVIIAPFGLRIRVLLSHLFPGVAGMILRRAYRRQRSFQRGSG